MALRVNEATPAQIARAESVSQDFDRVYAGVGVDGGTTMGDKKTMTVECIKKGGRRIPYIATGSGPIERVCSMACCQNKPKPQRYILLPCGCHSTFVKCTCSLKEAHCNKCGRNFITVPALNGKEWFEIDDPHEIGDLKACGAWWLWELKHAFPTRKKAHIARKWHKGSNLIGTCCSQQFQADDMIEVHPSHPDVEICGMCQRVASKNGIEVGNYQPRLK